MRRGAVLLATLALAAGCGSSSPRGTSGRSLQTLAAPVERSHVEPRLGRVGSAIAGRRIRVRCWSSADWPRVVREARARDHRYVDLLGIAWIDENVTDLA